MSEALEEALGADRDAAILSISSISKDSTLRDVQKVSRVVILLRKRAERIATMPGEAREWLISTLWSHPAWRPWFAARRHVQTVLGDYKRIHAKHSAKWYREKGSEARKTPEARAKLAAQKKAQRARARARAQQEAVAEYAALQAEDPTYRS